MLTVTITIDQKVDTEVIKMTNINECLGADSKGYVIVVNVKRDCYMMYVEIILLNSRTIRTVTIILKVCIKAFMSISNVLNFKNKEQNVTA